jgi:hypothetical protein
MTTNTHHQATSSIRSHAHVRIAGVLLVVAGITFLVYGPLHPGDSGDVTKTDALVEMLENPMWLPAHLVGLASYACFAAGAWAIRKGLTLSPTMSQVTGAVLAFGVVGTCAMVPHALAFAGADAVHTHGEEAFWYQFMTWNESIVNSVWALSVAVMVVSGGLTRTIGNRIILPLGLVGALAYALALATTPFVDTFEPLFPVSGLLALWSVTAGIMLVRRGVSA